MVKAAMKHLKKGAVIINTTSVTAYKGSAHLVDHSSTKGAITSFTRSLSQALADKCIRVNGVAPGPVCILHIPSTFPAKEVETFGFRRSAGSSWPTGINRAELRVSRVRRFFLHEMPCFTSKWWHHSECKSELCVCLWSTDLFAGRYEKQKSNGPLRSGISKKRLSLHDESQQLRICQRNNAHRSR